MTDTATMSPAAPVQVVASRFVTIKLATILTGLTDGAMRAKMNKGIWLEGREFVRRDGNVLIDMRGYERWAEHGRG